MIFSCCTLIIAASAVASAQPCFVLALSHTGSGTDPQPTPGNSDACASGEYIEGEVVSLVATPDPGWGVTAWLGTDRDSKRSTDNRVTMPGANHTVTVTYTDGVCWPLTLGHSGPGAHPAADYDSSPVCRDGEYVENTWINLTANPDPYSIVDSWTGTDDDSSSSPENRVTMPAASHSASVLYTEATDSFTSKLVPWDPGPTAQFGKSAAISGDTAVIGSPGALGLRADVYQQDQDGPDRWGLVKALVPLAPVSGGEFGTAVAISGGTIAVGAPTDTSGEPGAAYIFERDQGGTDNWGEVKKIQAPESAERDWFGRSVAIDTDTLAVGAPQDGVNRGAVWIFERNQGGANNWGYVKKIAFGVNDSWLGQSLALHGDLLVVQRRFDPPLYFKGEVYFFERSAGGAGNWGQVELKVTGGTGGDFGSGIAIDGDTVAIGDQSDSEAGTNAGAVNIYRRDAGGAGNWGLVHRLLGAGSQSRLGASVALSGDLLVAGATDSSEITPGLARLFSRNLGGADNWGLLDTLVPYDGTPGDYFGWAAGIDGLTMVVGAPYGPDDLWFGSAYVFEHEPPPACFALTLTHTGSGSDPIASPTASSGCDPASFHAGEVVTLTAAPDPDWEVSGWTGTNDDASTSLTNAVTMPGADHAVSVNYIETQTTPDHLHIHDEIIDSDHTYEACLSITAGPNVELTSGTIVFRSQSVVLDSTFSVGSGVSFTVNIGQPVACGAT